MRTRVMVVRLCVCVHVSVYVSVCVSVCYQSTEWLGGSYMKLNIPINFTLFSRSFQLTDIAKTVPWKSYSFTSSF